MANRRRPSNTKRQRERAQKERQESKVRRRAQRQAERSAPSDPLLADVPEVEVEEDAPAESVTEE